MVGDLRFYISGNVDENELLISMVLETFVEAVNILLREQVSKSVLMENYDYVLLIIDELLEDGIVLESDPETIVNRVAMKSSGDDTPLADQNISQAFSSAKDQFFSSLLKG